MTDYLYQSGDDFFAQVPDGGEEVATEELLGLGASKVTPGYRGVYFSADRDALYRIVYCALTISRVLCPLSPTQINPVTGSWEKR